MKKSLYVLPTDFPEEMKAKFSKVVSVAPLTSLCFDGNSEKREFFFQK